MALLIAEDLLLLLMDDREGKVGVDGTAADHALAGATVQRLAAGLRSMLRDRLVASGHLREETHRVLGVFPVRLLPETDPGHEDRVRTGLVDVLNDERRPTPREVDLLPLLDAVRGLRTVLPEETAALDDEQLAARVAEVSADGAVPAAVRRAVADARAAVDAAVMVALMGAAVGGTSGS